MDFNERLRKRAEARDCFLQAAAHLTRPNMPTAEHTAFAISDAALGLLILAEWDADEAGRRIVLETLRKFQPDAERTET